MILSHLTKSNQGTTCVACWLAAGALALVCASTALSQGSDKAKAGLEVWRSSGCSDCHGAFANGEKERDEAPTGANLRTARLDAAALKKIISCGKPGVEMPAFDEKAAMCGGEGGLYPAPRNLTSDEIDLVVAYLQARIIGHGRITKAECLAYYDGQEDMCGDFQ